MTEHAAMAEASDVSLVDRMTLLAVADRLDYLSALDGGEEYEAHEHAEDLRDAAAFLFQLAEHARLSVIPHLDAAGDDEPEHDSEPPEDETVPDEPATVSKNPEPLVKTPTASTVGARATTAKP